MTRFISLLCLCLCLFLSGCVLESKRPAFDDAQAALVFGDRVRSLQPWSLKDGVWVEESDEGGTVTLAAEGNYYVLTISEAGKTSTAAVSFIPLGGDRFVLQFEDRADKEEGFVYALGRSDGADMLFQPLMCGDLKERAADHPAIVFDGNDCRLGDGADALSLFRTLAESWTDFEQKMVPVD